MSKGVNTGRACRSKSQYDSMAMCLLVCPSISQDADSMMRFVSDSDAEQRISRVKGRACRSCQKGVHVGP
jgi:hypothetical protein